MNTQSKSTSFQTILDSLLDERHEFPRRYLQQFSDISELELKSLLDVWPRVKPSRKLALLEEFEALAASDSLVSFEDLARALLNDSDSSVRGRAIRLLGECSDTRLVPTYLDILNNDPDPQTRAEAATILNIFVDLGELEEIPEEIHRQVEDALLAIANGNDSSNVRRRALESLGYSSRSEVAALIESAFHREDPAWKTSALLAMGCSADERWEDEILVSLVDEDQNIKEAAVKAAGQLGLKSAGPILLKMLAEEEDDEITTATIWSLSQIGGEDARTYIESLLDQSEDDDQIEFLEEALENLAFTEDLDRFHLMSVDPEAELTDLDEDDEDE